MRGELQAFQSAIFDLEAALSEPSSAPPDLVRDAVLFRYAHALDLSLVVLRSALLVCFRESADALTVGELLRQARTRGLLPDAEQWLPLYAARFDPPLLHDPKRMFEQARAFAVRAKMLASGLDRVVLRNENASRDLSDQESETTDSR